MGYDEFTETDSRWYKTSEVALWMGVSSDRICQLVRRGLIAAKCEGHKYRIQGRAAWSYINRLPDAARPHKPRRSIA
jgi:hypothetical protein